MVFHRDVTRSYWTLPGGLVEPGETPEQAVVREVQEETGLDGQVVRALFDEGFGSGVCRCFLVQVDETQEASLGYDPEEIHLETETRLLQGIAWRTLESLQGDAQIMQAIASLSRGDW